MLQGWQGYQTCACSLVTSMSITLLLVVLLVWLCSLWRIQASPVVSTAHSPSAFNSTHNALLPPQPPMARHDGRLLLPCRTMLIALLPASESVHCKHLLSKSFAVNFISALRSPSLCQFEWLHSNESCTTCVEFGAPGAQVKGWM